MRNLQKYSVRLGKKKKKIKQKLKSIILGQAIWTRMKKRKTFKDKHKVKKTLSLWLQHLGNGLPTIEPTLQIKTFRFFWVLERLNSKFTASDRYLDHFKKWFGIRQITMSEETLSADKEAVFLSKGYLVKFFQLKKNSQEQLYECMRQV